MATVTLVNFFGDERDMYSEFLSAQGHFTVTALECDSADAVQEAGRLQPDVVVTDIWCHRAFDGIGFVRQLRQDSRTKQIAIVVITSHVFDSDRTRALDAGADIFLPKPCLPAVT